MNGYYVIFYTCLVIAVLSAALKATGCVIAKVRNEPQADTSLEWPMAYILCLLLYGIFTRLYLVSLYTAWLSIALYFCLLLAILVSILRKEISNDLIVITGLWFACQDWVGLAVSITASIAMGIYRFRTKKITVEGQTIESPRGICYTGFYRNRIPDTLKGMTTMDKEMMDMFQTIITGMQDMETRINKKFDAVDARFDEVNEKFDEVNLRIDTEVRGLKILIETDVSKRIETLFDGYQLAHEKQWVMDKRLDELEARMERLETLQQVG